MKILVEKPVSMKAYVPVKTSHRVVTRLEMLSNSLQQMVSRERTVPVTEDTDEIRDNELSHYRYDEIKAGEVENPYLDDRSF